MEHVALFAHTLLPADSARDTLEPEGYQGYLIDSPLWGVVHPVGLWIGALIGVLEALQAWQRLDPPHAGPVLEECRSLRLFCSQGLRRMGLDLDTLRERDSGQRLALLHECFSADAPTSQRWLTDIAQRHGAVLALRQSLTQLREHGNKPVRALLALEVAAQGLARAQLQTRLEQLLHPAGPAEDDTKESLDPRP